MKRRALLSVYDKAGIVEFARGLVRCGFELVSSGGTSAALADAGIDHLSVEAVTEFPEMLDGRVKTLHPRLHGGILADRTKPEHLAMLEAHGIGLVDVVVCNLYPFTSNPSIELIDVGGPSMVRAAAKNHASVAVLVDPAEYGPVLAELSTDGSVSDATRRRLAAAAFAHTAAYDAAIAAWFASEATSSATTGADGVLPERLTIELARASVLRYGENPHQNAARYRLRDGNSWWDSMVQHGGKELSYLNVFDADAAWNLVHDLGDRPAVAIIKHANPCGVAVASTIGDAYRMANACDPVSAFGGIVALNRIVDADTAESLSQIFTEVIVAPGFDPSALDLLAAKKNLRLLEAKAPHKPAFTLRTIDGGYLVQEPDNVAAEVHERKDWQVVTVQQPTDAQWADLLFAWTVCAHVSSNAIVIAAGAQAAGIGAGQQSRVDATEIAVRKAGERAVGAVCASDAFFPFRDGLDLLAAAGVRAVIQPGGSVRDPEVIAAADEHGIAMVFTSHRHFRH